MKLPILARGVQHLTDARYFAAIEVDYICFDHDVDTALRSFEITAIAEWVAGPDIVVEGKPIEGLFSLTAQDDVETIVDLKGNVVAKIHTVEDVRQFDYSQIGEDTSCRHYLQSALTEESIQYLLKNYPTVGIVLQGAAEDSTGLKSFDHFESIIELLEEY